MIRMTKKLILCAALLSIYAASEAVYARPAGAGAAAAAGAAGGAGLRGAAAAAVTKAQATNTPAETSQQAALDNQSDGVIKNNQSQTAVSPCPPPPTLMDGAYMGLQLGYGTYRIHNNVQIPAISASFNAANAATGWAAGALFGYGKVINRRFYLGGEIFFDGNNFEQTSDFAGGTFPYSNQTTSGPIYGIGLLPGIKMTNETLTYIRLGWSRLEIKTKESIAGVLINNVSKLTNSFVFGIGMETLITSSFSVRAEYDKMYFSSYNTDSFYNTKVSPSSAQFMLSIITHF